MDKKIKVEIYSGSFRPIQYSLVFALYSGADARKKLWIPVFCLSSSAFVIQKKNLRDKFAIFGDYLYFVMGSAEFVFTTIMLIVKNSTSDQTKF